jgi:hypothetical protein
MTQPEQQLRRVVEMQLRRREIEPALATMSAHDRDDFPAHWDPPPRVGYGETHPPMLDVMEIVVASTPKLWVRQLFVEKYRHFLGWGHGALAFWGDLDDDQKARHLLLLEQLPEGREIVAQQEDLLHYAGLWTDSQKERLEALLASGETDLPGAEPQAGP